MKSKLTAIALLFVAVFTFTACLDTDDNDYVYTDDSAIAAFSVQTAKRYIHTKTKAGKDSVYTATTSLTSYRFIIDQRKCEIYNPDSLPYGVDATKLLVSASAINSGSVLLKSLTSDSLRYVTSSDSLDFSKQRELQVVSMSGSATRKYKVTVNVHKEDPDSFVWQAMPTSDLLNTLVATKLVATASSDGHTRLFLAGSDGSKTLVFILEGKNTWSNVTANINVQLANEAYQSLVAKDGTAYIVSDGTIFSTSDGSTWQQDATQTGITRLVAANPVCLYGYDAEGKLLSSTDGKAWQMATLDDESSLLPTGETTYATLPLKTNADAYRTLIIGCGSTGSASYMTIWGKIDEATADSQQQQWNYYTPSSLNHHQAPLMEGFGAGVYGDRVLLAGKQKNGGAAFYMSKDAGLTWEKDTVVVYPRMLPDKRCAVTVDKDNFIWVVDPKTGNTWRGRTNKLGWKKEQYEFNE